MAYLNNKNKGYSKRIAISEENLKRFRKEAMQIWLRFHPEDKHRNIPDNFLFGRLLDHWCDKTTL